MTDDHLFIGRKECPVKLNESATLYKEVVAPDGLCVTENCIRIGKLLISDQHNEIFSYIFLNSIAYILGFIFFFFL